MEKKRFIAPRIGRWTGGYIRTTKVGRPVFIIELWRKGRKWHISTGCATKRAAEKELERFELDPMGYSPGDYALQGLDLSAELVLAYRKYQLAAGLTKAWADQVARNLADWQIALKGRDLRALKLHRDLRPALDGWGTQLPHRIKAIKGLFRWLRQERGLVERHQDATLDLRVPQARPEKQRRPKAVLPEHVAAVLRELPVNTRDILHLLTATAWHVSEARRFCGDGSIAQPLNQDGVLAVLTTRHKSGDLVSTPILYPEHLEAAKRVQALSRFPESITISRHMREACDKAKVPRFSAGQMRHSVLTWGVRDGGASLYQAKEFANHRSESTTRRFYVHQDVPKNALPVYRLMD